MCFGTKATLFVFNFSVSIREVSHQKSLLNVMWFQGNKNSLQIIPSSLAWEAWTNFKNKVCSGRKVFFLPPLKKGEGIPTLCQAAPAGKEMISALTQRHWNCWQSLSMWNSWSESWDSIRGSLYKLYLGHGHLHERSFKCLFMFLWDNVRISESPKTCVALCGKSVSLLLYMQSFRKVMLSSNYVNLCVRGRGLSWGVHCSQCLILV